MAGASRAVRFDRSRFAQVRPYLPDRALPVPEAPARYLRASRLHRPAPRPHSAVQDDPCPWATLHKAANGPLLVANTTTEIPGHVSKRRPATATEEVATLQRLAGQWLAEYPDPSHHVYAMWPAASGLPDDIVEALGDAASQYGNVPSRFLDDFGQEVIPQP